LSLNSGNVRVRDKETYKGRFDFKLFISLGKNPHWDDTLTMIRVDEPSIVVTLVDIDKFKTDLIG
jgi:hypothetical protein